MDIMYLKYSKNEKKATIKKGNIILNVSKPSKRSNVISLNEVRKEEKTVSAKKHINAKSNYNSNNMLISSISNVHNSLLKYSQEKNNLDSVYSSKVIELASIPKIKKSSSSTSKQAQNKTEDDTNSEITKFFFEAVHKNYIFRRK